MQANHCYSVHMKCCYYVILLPTQSTNIYSLLYKLHLKISSSYMLQLIRCRTHLKLLRLRSRRQCVGIFHQLVYGKKKAPFQYLPHTEMEVGGGYNTYTTLTVSGAEVGCQNSQRRARRAGSCPDAVSPGLAGGRTLQATDC